MGLTTFQQLTGKQFGKWTVLGIAGKRKNSIYWNCKCECGKTKAVDGRGLRDGRTKSCGCSFKTWTPKNRLPAGEASFNCLFSRYKLGAKPRGHEFALTKVEFRELVTKDCFYCGVKPSTEFSHKQTNESFLFNGLDRLDPKKGYTLSNVATCCKDCNYAKKNMLPEQFISFVKRVYEHQFGGKK